MSSSSWASSTTKAADWIATLNSSPNTDSPPAWSQMPSS